jgi:signal transduction histidine kinase
MERGVLVGAAVLRWASWVWLTIVALTHLDRDRHVELVLLCIAITGAVTVAASAPLAGGRSWTAALRPPLVAVEIGAALLIVLADGWVMQGRLTGQTLAGSWPIPSILVAALAGGLLWGSATAVMLAVARAVAVAVAGWAPGGGGRAALAAVSTGIEWIAFGVVCAVVIRLLRRAQEQIASVEARERVARDLHDGVLQTLTLIERRSDSPDVSRLARDQERSLRAYLFGDFQRPGELGPALREAARRFERSWPSVAVTVSVSPDVTSVSGKCVEAVSAAVSEALTNAAKHGEARSVVLFADLDEATRGLFVSVKDDGSGFDVSSVVPRVGMTSSIRGRIDSVGGRVEFASAKGDGTEVRMWVPTRVPSPRT